ncbi:sensor histidine kinase [Pseudoflavonifractor sp. 524-17]|uniref:sensor histidine kinase n=1 Tax=Pseudoflavonifractor sp. 524-17 TaxID=2304577 RepID=UPI00137A88EA|nr:HAMP domain-containing sensor histidine kinase [Pseudoflavonifractor sp. 524-17]NCE64534.1 sensor histidine kinase [Pseudoflavonifractor sp. 524-17]
MMVVIILISFALLGSSFITLTYRYTLQEKQEVMARNAEVISEYTSSIQQRGGSLLSTVYQDYVSSFARISDADVLICDAQGHIQLYSSGAIRESLLDMNGYTDAMIPELVRRTIAETGEFSALSNLGGIFAERRYVAGRPVYVTDILNQRHETNLVFVAADSSSLMELWQAVTSIFFFTAVVVLCIAFISSSVTTLHQTRPLKEIADAARKFGHGEFDARVVGYEKRQDEVGELAEAFNTMADSLAQSEAKRSEFIANISHELKTPMTTIAGFADGILDNTIPPEQEREYLKTISAETRRLSRLVRKMLDLSRLQSSENVTAQERFDVVEVMLRVLVSLETKINARHLDVDTSLPEESVTVWGDTDAITQVCYNLLDNAIKFAAGGTAIGIKVAAKGSKAFVSVRNTGETIAPEELPLVFDRFHKTDRSRSVDRDGVGLGLYIVKTILGSHKENITVTSEDGVTEFTFTLTLA